MSISLTDWRNRMTRQSKVRQDRAGDNYFYCLDGLKGIACMLVVIWHYFEFAPDYLHLNQVRFDIPLSIWGYDFSIFGNDSLFDIFTALQLQRQCVQLFFFIGGFIFMYKYRDVIQERKLNFKTYSILRVSHLYPLVVLTVFTMIIIRIIGGANVNAFDAIKNLLLMNGTNNSYNVPMWTLPQELVTYIVFFLICRFIPSKHHLTLYVAFIALGVFICDLNFNTTTIFSSKSFRAFTGFFAGTVTYYIYARIKEAKYKKLIGAISSVVVFLATILEIKYGYTTVIEQNSNIQFATSLFIFPCLLFGVMFVGGLQTFLSVKPLVFLGKISLAIYLLHWPILSIIELITWKTALTISADSKWAMLLIFSIIISISAVLHYFYERPMQKIIRSLFS